MEVASDVNFPQFIVHKVLEKMQQLCNGKDKSSKENHFL